MKIVDKLMEYLAKRPEGVDDATIAHELKVNHDQVNQHCRRLKAAGIVKRQRSGGVIKNIIIPGATLPARRPEVDPAKCPWHWEGHVQSRIAAYLTEQGVHKLKCVDTVSREAGKDIIAERDGKPVWVTVKGYPGETGKSPAATQARHWFEAAFFELLQWRGESTDAALYIGLPDFPTYRTMLTKVRWLGKHLKHHVLWVSPKGEVTAQDGQSAGDVVAKKPAVAKKPTKSR